MKTIIGLLIISSLSCNSGHDSGVIANNDTITKDSVCPQKTLILIDSLQKRNKYLQHAGDSLLRRTITMGFTYKVIKRYVSITKNRPALEKYKNGWILRAIDLK